MVQRSPITESVAVVQGDTPVFAKGYGVTQAGTQQAVDADTVFQLASMSKSLGSTVVARQVGKGIVDWDTPMHTLLPWFALSDPSVTQQLTVGDLYAHRSGLPDHVGDQLEDLGYDRTQGLERLRYVPLDGFRTQWHYTNFGMTAAAEGVATVSGIDWATLSEQALYQPLGMTRTSSRFSDFNARSNRAVGHVPKDGQFVPGPVRDPDAQSPAGVLNGGQNKRLSVSTGEKEKEYLIALFGEGKPEFLADDHASRSHLIDASSAHSRPSREVDPDTVDTACRATQTVEPNLGDSCRFAQTKSTISQAFVRSRDRGQANYRDRWSCSPEISTHIGTES
jgi:hypothetical protein